MNSPTRLSENSFSREHDRLATIARSGGIIALYHGVWPDPPAALAGGVHNVTPDTLGQQLELLQAHFTIVSVDEFVEAREHAGLAAISFDDGYRCISNHGLAVFEAFNVPLTIYVNGATFRGDIFWRDKVRFIQERNLIGDFEEFAHGITNHNGKRFYRYTKNPANNSAHVNTQIDEFLMTRGLFNEMYEQHHYCMQNIDELLVHPLVSYGNHSQSHYVMSSLRDDEQHEEILQTQRLLESRRGIQLSQVFSIPFGELADFNEATVEAVRDAGYRGVLLSRARVHQEDIAVHAMAVV